MKRFSWHKVTLNICCSIPSLKPGKAVIYGLWNSYFQFEAKIVQEILVHPTSGHNLHTFHTKPVFCQTNFHFQMSLFDNFVQNYVFIFCHIFCPGFFTTTAGINQQNRRLVHTGANPCNILLLIKQSIPTWGEPEMVWVKTLKPTVQSVEGFKVQLQQTKLSTQVQLELVFCG